TQRTGRARSRIQETQRRLTAGICIVGIIGSRAHTSPSESMGRLRIDVSFALFGTASFLQRNGIALKERFCTNHD
ncbi:hypothetical protein LK490_22365, partial [Blautia sp. MSK22_86]|nr:hypothetical protein [Blautia sp. MSK22_86]